MKTNSSGNCFGITSKAIYFTLFLCASLFASTANAQSLATDQPDYAPNTTATISGFGFYVGESVTMHVTYADGSPLPAPYGSTWIVTADANGSFTTTWYVCNCPWASLVATANGDLGSYADVYFTDSGIDFQQAGNENHPTDPIDWINGIAQQNTSDYFEGMGTPQRIILFDIPSQPGDNHTLTMEHQAVKGDVHAYDFLMSWNQAIQTGANIGNQTTNELLNLNAQTCGTAISASGAAVCAAAQALGFPPHPNIALLSVPDLMGNPPNHNGNANVNDIITCFEAIYGDRTIEIRGNAPITAASIVFTGYTGSASGDNYATYTINWTSASDDIIIKLAGRSAAGPGTCGYGAGFGAGAINGGPYHFKLHQLDGASLGSQDNQLTAPIIEAPPTCDSVHFSGPQSVCPTSTGHVYSATIDGCTNGTHNWFLSNNTSGASIVGSNTGASVTVDAGSACGSFEICDSITCDEGNVVCCYPVNVADQTAPVFSNCNAGTDLGCNPTVPSCANVTAPSATDNCFSSVSISCSDGSVINTSTCGRSRTITWTATDGCQNSSTCNRTWTWTADTDAPTFDNCAPGTDLGCNPTVPSCANQTAPTASDNCTGTPTVGCSDGSIINTSTCGRSRTLTYTATDDCGNSSTCQRTWTWTADTSLPTFTNCSPGTDLGCNPTVPSCANQTAPSATDNCTGTPTVGCSDGSIINTSTCGRSRTLTYTATDDCGNSSTCQRTWTWTEDTTAPVFTNCNPGTDLGCNPTVPTCANQTAPSATDNCGGTATVGCSAGSVVNTSTCGRSRTLTYTATDACANTSTCQRTWTWTEDTAAPVFTNCNPGTDLGCNPTVPSCANQTAPSATDNCGGTATVGCSQGSIINTSTCGRSRTLTYTATDACGNSSTCQRTWTWTADTDGPEFDCPADATVLCGDPWDFGTPTASDDCSGQATVIETGTDTTANSDGSTTYCRHWEASDACGNVSTCTQCITVMCVGDLFCGFTQGFWGNSGGLDCEGNDKQTILTALLQTQLVVGCAANTFTVGVGDYQCVIDRLPGGGPAAQIFGNNTCASIVGIALHAGDPARFRNVLLAQTITTMLNVRYDVNLGNLAIGGIYLTTIGSDGCDTSATPSGDPSVYVIPQSIIDYLGSNNTVNDLVALANDALCGAYVPSGPGEPTLGDIVKALDAFNQGFDECRFLISFSNTLREGHVAESNYGFSMLAYPNPFNSMTSIDFTADKAYNNVKVEVFSMNGALVATLFNSPVAEGGAYRTNFDGSRFDAGVYTYRITTDTDSYFDKLILIK